uniref:PH domain-containing protein n=1 Tax=viral metagenome TaxID=1070528 RepID=A0A6C0KET8_9ZZZZ
MEGVLSRETDSQTITVNFNNVVEQDGEILGIFYLKVTSKKFFSKWSERFFMLRKNKLIILKRKNNGRPRYSTSKFLKLEKCELSGISMEEDKIIFNVYYKDKRVYKFGTKSMDVFTQLYSTLDRRIYNTKNLLSEDLLDEVPN